MFEVLKHDWNSYLVIFSDIEAIMFRQAQVQQFVKHL